MLQRKAVPLQTANSLGIEWREPTAGARGTRGGGGGTGRGRRRWLCCNYNYKDTHDIKREHGAPPYEFTAATLFPASHHAGPGGGPPCPRAPGRWPLQGRMPPRPPRPLAGRILVARGGGLARPPSRHLLASVHPRRPSHTNTIFGSAVPGAVFPRPRVATYALRTGSQARTDQ